MSTFSKPPLSVANQLDQWIDRGLHVPDREQARHYLSVISYYRLSAYTLPFQVGNPEHHFRPGTSFGHILDLYIFDRELRLLLLDAIERIEVALRASMTNILSHHHGSHAYLQTEIFDTRYDHPWLIQRVRKQCEESHAEPFIAHYRSNYSLPELPPIWMVMEILTFKEVSVLFANLKQQTDKKAFARFWGLPDPVLRSWFRALSDLRNVCAHHSRTWNREFGSRPLIPKKKPSLWPDLQKPLADPCIEPTRRLYYFLVVIETLLRIANPESTWRWRLKELMERHPGISRAHMGMPDDWMDDPFWRFQGVETE